MGEWPLAEPQTHHGEVGVVFGEAQAQFGLHLGGHSLQHAVKYVVVPLIRSLEETRIKHYDFPFMSAGHVTKATMAHDIGKSSSKAKRSRPEKRDWLLQAGICRMT